MTSTKKVPLQGLEIAKLDDSGNASRRINCLPGRITVLRSVRPMEAKLYEEALSGQDCSANFSILYQGQPFNPAEASVIGVGSDFNSDSETVHEFLSRLGTSEESRRHILSTAGLEDMEQASCADLSKAQQRALRLLTIPLTPGSPAVLIDPFAHLPKPLVELIARELIEFVSTELALIVVPKLVVKPDAWIENEYVSRAQLERPRQATVGFGSDAISRDELLEQMKKEGLPRRGSQVLGVDLTAVDIGDHKRAPAQLLRLFFIAVLGGGAVMGAGKMLSQPAPKQQIAAQNTNVTSEPIEEDSETNSKYQAYPVEVAESVMAAFMRPDEIIKQSSQAFVTTPNNTVQQTEPETVNRFAPQADAAADTPPAEESQEEMAERRRQIYERFMEAINRARANQESRNN